MTDDERLPDPLAAAAALPRGSLVVARARDTNRRAALVRSLMGLARSRPLTILVAADPELAARAGADGLHLPAARLQEIVTWRARYPQFLISVAAHTVGELMAASEFGADAAFLSPIFPTASHPGRAALTSLRANLIAKSANLPVYALGGVTPENAGLLGNGFMGIAAIGALAV